MATMLELPTLAKYLFGVLAPAVATTGFGAKVYRGSLAPQGVQPPYLLYFQQVGLDDYCLPAYWAGAQVTYFVKGVALAGQYQSVLLPGMAAANGALTAAIDTPGTQDGYTITVLGSDDPREYEELLPGGQVVVHYGRSWMLAVEPTS
jgi:hypothetical protein